MLVATAVFVIYCIATYFTGNKMTQYLHNHGAWSMMRMGLPNKITANLNLILTSIAGAIYANFLALCYLFYLLL